MDIFKKAAPPQNEYLQKYMEMASRFQNVGIAVVIFSVALHFLGGTTFQTASILIFCAGAAALVFGGSSLRPHNLIKSFALQCSREPGDIIADGLLEAMERNKKTALTKSSIRTVYLAIESYGSLPEADSDLVSRLKTAAERNLSQKKF